MGIDAIIVLVVILAAIVLFATEYLSIDLVALLIILSLVCTGVITPAEGVIGFSNPATITIGLMFVLSAGLLKTGVMQRIGPGLTRIFSRNFRLGFILMIVLVAAISAFVNNTPVVAVLIPVVVQVANQAKISPSKLLIPLSFASIFGGTCTLLGTSTNILVSGIAQSEGIEGFSMFQLTPMGIVFLGFGLAFMVLFGIRLLPQRKQIDGKISKYALRNYLTEIELLPQNENVGQRIMDAPLVKEFEMEIIEIRRGDSRFTLPQGDMVLKSGDFIKVRCDVERIKRLKDHIVIKETPSILVGDFSLQGIESTIVEMVLTSYSSFEGRTLREIDFRRSYRAAPLAIMQREDVVHENLQDVRLRAGDVILAEVKNHYLPDLKSHENVRNNPFIVLSEKVVPHFKRKQLMIVSLAMVAMIVLAALKIIPIMVGALGAVTFLVLFKVITMNEMYQAINWKLVVLLAGTISLGIAMQKSGLAHQIAELMVSFGGNMGPIFILSMMYLSTAIFTEFMSNSASAGLMAPIAIAVANQIDASPIPFLMAVTFAASASFITPIGYQTNTMVYSAGQYKFFDYARIGLPLSLLFWLLATFLIPVFYPL